MLDFLTITIPEDAAVITFTSSCTLYDHADKLRGTEGGGEELI